MSLTKSVVLLLSAFSCAQALIAPHGARDVHHRAVAARVAAPTSEIDLPLVVPKKRDLRKRSLSKRCSAHPVPSSNSTSPVASSSAASSSVAATPAAAVNVGSDPSSIFSSSSSVFTPAATTSSVDSPPPTTSTSVYTPPATTSTSVYTPPATTSSSTAAAPTSASSSDSSSVSSFLAGTNSGDGTFYEAGLGACGITNSDTDYICAVSEILFDGYPGYAGVNPNDNPVCGRQITAHYGGASVTVTVTDRCTGCDETSLDFTPTAFSQLANESLGRIAITWEWS